MVKMMVAVKEVKRMRLFGVNIAKEVRRMRLFGKDIWSEVDILDQQQQQQLQSPPVLPSAAAVPSPPLLLPAEPLPYNSLSSSHSTAPPAKGTNAMATKIKIKFIAPRPPAANNIAPQLPPQVLATIQNLGGTGLAFLANKKVEVSDVDKRLNRLFIPKDAVATILKALTAEEKTILKIRGDRMEKKNKKNGKNNNNARVHGRIIVAVVNGKGKRHDMDFKKWPSLGKLVFANQWYKFAKESDLEGGVDSVQLWCFRDVHSRLCFSVVKGEMTYIIDAMVQVARSTAAAAAAPQLAN